MNYQFFYKRVFDLILSLSVLFFLCPFFFLLTIILAIYYKGSPFFFQKRLGKDAKVFNIIKFKSMSDSKDESGKLLPDEKRLTSFGKFLRKTSLDELPQLINVLKGEMSLVGPRPLLPNYQNLYNDFQKQRNAVKPGITGWAQVNGRNNVPWKQRFEMDVYYAHHISFLFDLKILFLTVINICKFSNVNEDGFATASDFEGN